ncbi:MAG: oleate hydratase, partial [Clostridium sp.]
MRNKKTNNKMNNKFVMVSALAGGAAAAAAIYANKKCKEHKALNEITLAFKDHGEKQAYFIGGGLASMAGAAYLIRDCNFKGENIHIIEGMNILGGSNDGAGDVQNGFVCRGGRMLNEETYENFWELFSTIPSIENEKKSVTEEILNFDHQHPTKAQARLIDKFGVIQDVSSMGFDNKDRITLGKLMATPERKLDNLTIEDWFKSSPHFFETNFWYMWQTTFAFQKWSSLFEFKRYMERMIFEFPRIETLEGVTRTPYNQYDSVILPIKQYLEKENVDFSIRSTVTDLDFKEGEEITVSAIHCDCNGEEKIITLNSDDI